MNLAWAKEWMGSFSAAGLEKALGMYAEDVQFEDVTFAHKANGKADLRKFFSGVVAPGAGEHVFTPTAYCGNADAGAVEWTGRARDLPAGRAVAPPLCSSVAPRSVIAHCHEDPAADTPRLLVSQARWRAMTLWCRP